MTSQIGCCCSRILVRAATTLSSFEYNYDQAGNRTQVVEADGSAVTWTYDPTYQLTNERRSGTTSYNITYVYDGVGNRTLLVNNGAPTTYAYNAANELSKSQNNSGVTTYTSDGDGNLLTALAPGSQLTTNTWDGESRLSNVALPSGAVNTFLYSADGHMIQKDDSLGTTGFVWDFQNILLETSSTNVIQTLYTMEPQIYGNLIAQVRDGVSSFFAFDGLGSTRQPTNAATGAITDSYLSTHSVTFLCRFRFDDESSLDSLDDSVTIPSPILAILRPDPRFPVRETDAG